MEEDGVRNAIDMLAVLALIVAGVTTVFNIYNGYWFGVAVNVVAVFVILGLKRYNLERE